MSIQAGLSGLSFLILDTFSDSIVNFIAQDFEKKCTPKVLLEKIIEAFNTHESLQATFAKVQIIHHNEMQTLVPVPLFEEAHLSDYLKYNTKIFKTDFITYDAIQNEDMMLVYVPYVNVNNYIFERFGSFEYKHTATVLIDKILQLEKNNSELKVFVNVEPSCFDLIVVKDDNLLLYNQFEYQTKEDFIYYILFTAEQLELNPEHFKCVLLGAIAENDALYAIIYKYIRHVSMLGLSNIRCAQNNSTQNFTLLNSI